MSLVLDIKDLHPIGIGTWTISKANYAKDIKGLMYSFENGQNSIECNASYLAGESLDVVADFIKHIDENLQALDFEMSADDYLALDDFRQPFFDNMKVKYRENGEDILIHQVPNQDLLGKEKYVASYGTNKETMKID